jgi:hypothetical protein
LTVIDESSGSAADDEPRDPVAACGSGVGIGIVESSACIDVTRKKINRKKTISTIAVMSIRSSKSIFGEAVKSGASESGGRLEGAGGAAAAAVTADSRDSTGGDG